MELSLSSSRITTKSTEAENVIAEVGVKSNEISRKAKSEGSFLFCSITEVRRSGYQTGLDTPVVQTDNDEYSYFINWGMSANAISILPGEYGRKTKTQRNWREFVTGGGALLFNATVHANLNQTMIWD